MDTVISNKYKDILNTLDIEVSKKLEGEYSVEEIINTFKNFFFNKMFLDITAIEDYKDLTNLEVILVDDGSTDNSLEVCNTLKKEVNQISIEVITGQNEGVSAARNKALKVAKSPISAKKQVVLTTSSKA